MPPNLKEQIREKLSWLPRYMRPIQVDDNCGKRDETADMVEMLKEEQVVEAFETFINSLLQDKIRMMEERKGDVDWNNISTPELVAKQSEQYGFNQAISIAQESLKELI